jgi:hypothetical protein
VSPEKCYYTYTLKEPKVMPSTTGYPFSDQYARYEIVYVIVRPLKRIYKFVNGYLIAFDEYFGEGLFSKKEKDIASTCVQIKT